MAVWAHWTVFCDRCSRWTDNTIGETNRLARENARSAGWFVSPRLQLCPDCRKKTGR